MATKASGMATIKTVGVPGLVWHWVWQQRHRVWQQSSVECTPVYGYGNKGSVGIRGGLASNHGYGNKEGYGNKKQWAAEA
eukprot:6693028-Karenia_brevis.AAC.1